jgi:hypothetical protein
MGTQLTELVSGFSVRDYLQDFRWIYSRGLSEMMGLFDFDAGPARPVPTDIVIEAW